MEKKNWGVVLGRKAYDFDTSGELEAFIRGYAECRELWKYARYKYNTSYLWVYCHECRAWENAKVVVTPERHVQLYNDNREWGVDAVVGLACTSCGQGCVSRRTGLTGSTGRSTDMHMGDLCDMEVRDIKMTNWHYTFGTVGLRLSSQVRCACGANWINDAAWGVHVPLESFTP